MNTQLANLHYSEIAAVSEAIRQKKLSLVELVSGCLERIQHLNPMLNAFITVTAGEAMKEARIAEREIQEGGWKGPLHGIPIAAKDMFDTAGIRTTAAFHAFADRVPARDAEIVTQVKAAGACPADSIPGDCR
jgi:aspartyl-tRNA(Asn)/glutamyl-tRNA(Gln) amidotransferase subunit A